jgi:Dyp-type peroxidase family
MIEPELAVSEIQGHSLRGFDTPALALLGLTIDQAPAVRAWLAALSYRIDTLDRVHRYRITRSFGPVRTPRVLLNIALSAHGLAKLGVNLSNVEDSLFLGPMGQSAAMLGDSVDAAQAPIGYVLGKAWEDTPDILLIVGGDTPKAAEQLQKALAVAGSMAGCVSMYREQGGLLPGEVEHFGFRDGISQVGVRGRLSNIADDYLTLRFLSAADPQAELLAKPGQPLVWPGQFVFGYPTELPGSPFEPGPGSDGGAEWMRNGSFLVFRRLRQDVTKFRSFLQRQATELSRTLGRTISSEEVGAMIVGRWRNGSPVLLTPTAPDSVIATDELMVNDFAYGQGTPAIHVTSSDGAERVIPPQPDDSLAQRCPHFAHIRKVNPRDLTTDQGIPGRTLTFQMLRRGIPYGSPYDAMSPDSADRGLLFLAYQTSFKRQFLTLNSTWMNNPSAPEVTDEGYDILVGQNPGGDIRTARLRDPAGAPVATLATSDQWVIPTGGGFFFAPSISFLRSLN